MINLPFVLKECSQECGAECGSEITNCPIYAELPPELQEICQTRLHLLQYLHSIPLDQIGMPQFFQKLNRNMKSAKNRNLIYQVNDEVFIHILANTEDIRDYYIPIEPCLFGDANNYMEKVEHHLVNYVEELEGINEGAERLKVILKIVDRLVVIKGIKGKYPDPANVNNP